MQTFLDESQTIKSSRNSWMVFIVGVGFTATAFIGPGTRPELWPLLLAILAVAGLVTTVCLRHHVIVSASGITIYEVFSKTEVLFDQIQQLNIKQLKKGHYALEVEGPTLPESPLQFSLVLYHPVAITSLVKAVEHFAPQAKLGIYAENVKRGSFP